MHPIDEIMEERCPNLMKNKILWSFIKPTIFKVFKYYDAKRIVDDMGYQLDLVSTVKRAKWIKEIHDPKKVIYMGDGIFDHYVMKEVGYSIAPRKADQNAKKLVEDSKMEYIENKCTKMEYQKHFLKIRQAFPALSD